MDIAIMTCPYCGGSIPQGTTICPDCHEELAGLAKLEYAQEIYYNQALSLAREGKLDEARNRVLMALELREDFGPAHLLLAKVYAKQGAWEEAGDSVARASALLPEDDDVAELAKEIDHVVAQRVKARRESALSRRQNAERLLRARQRDVMGAFVVGIGLMVFLMTVSSWFRADEEEGAES